MSKHQQYEMYKQDWLNNHPNATYQEYQQAMQVIAKKVGI